MTDTLPPLEPGQCGSCGATDRPVKYERCDLCAAVHGPASAPEHISTIVERVMHQIEGRRPEVA